MDGFLVACPYSCWSLSSAEISAPRPSFVLSTSLFGNLAVIVCEPEKHDSQRTIASVEGCALLVFDRAAQEQLSLPLHDYLSRSVELRDAYR